MALENYTGNISDLVVTNPTPTDPKSQGDDHLRGIKYTLKQSFPNFDGPMTAGPEEVERAASSVPPGGLPFCKNKLFNGEVTRINQRGFDGDWAAKNTWAAGNTIAQQELCYGYDMWAKASATDMVQVIEAGNFRPSTVHTLSGTGVATQQITSPASGNWTITVPQTARNVQVEEGDVATPFEIRPISFELAQCQRYYENCNPAQITYGNVGGAVNVIATWKVRKRVGPSVRFIDSSGNNIDQVTTFTTSGVATGRSLGPVTGGVDGVNAAVTVTDVLSMFFYLASAVI